MNSLDSPADRGSIIVLIGTGIGAIDPQGEDGKITRAGGALPVPVLSVSVQIDGQPESVAPWYIAPVTIKVGDYMSPSTITLNVR